MVRWNVFEVIVYVAANANNFFVKFSYVYNFSFRAV